MRANLENFLTLGSMHCSLFRWGSFRWGLSLCGFCLFTLPTAASEPISFNRDIRPLLSNHCFQCHGPDQETREGGLRLDRPDSAAGEADSGMRAIVPGNVDESEMIARITSDDESMRMPPSDIGPPLKPAEIEKLRQWIAEGANYERHWSLQPIRQPQLPLGSDAQSAIDHLVNIKLQQVGLTPNPRADRETLARRVSLAITGLPPTPEEVDRFLSDPSPDAYERWVDRLLASPEYGERWARIWLDLARYADSAGYAQDPDRTIWRYRDWVIDAYNQNMPFDEFTILQIAGDLLPSPTTEQLLATAFHRNTMTNSEGGTDDEEFRVAAVVDRVNTTMQVWMGLTAGCAQCHDHKYDDMTQQEYFELYAIFNNTADADRGDESPWIEELSSTQKEEKASLESERTAIQQKLNSAESEAQQQLQGQLEKVTKRLNEIRGIRTPILRELPSEKSRTTYVHVRGDFRQTGESVDPGTPEFLHAAPSSPDRLDFARWLVSPENPLTARVVVNRYWELLFGTGMVVTSEDFGVQGDLPTHPQLLEYLASELMRHDWDIKWLIRTIVSTEAYMRHSEATPAMLNIDSANQYLARGPSFRLPAEMIRDQALSVAGLLSKKKHGPSVRPPRPKLGLRAAFGGSTDWESSSGEDRYRRGLYTSWRRTSPYPSMATFDAPSREACTIRRIRTNTPLQALVTLNDPVFVEAAQGLARRIYPVATESGLENAIRFAFQIVLAREPSDLEIERLTDFHRRVSLRYEKAPKDAEAMASDPLGPIQGVDMSQLAAWTVVSNVLLNLDETLAPR